MKLVIIFILEIIMLIQGFFVKNDSENGKKMLPASHIHRIRSDVNFIECEWDPIENKDVIGYKLKLWVIGRNITRKVRIMRLRSTELYNKPPTIEVVTPANVTKAKAEGIELDVPYAVRVAAFTDTEEGPLSASFGITVHSEEYDKREKEKNERMRDLLVLK